MPVGNGLNIGILAGEMIDYNIEISNIIIRNSKITDNKETYTTPEIVVGGIIGKALDDKNTESSTCLLMWISTCLIMPHLRTTPTLQNV